MKPCAFRATLSKNGDAIEMPEPIFRLVWACFRHLSGKKVLAAAAVND